MPGLLYVGYSPHSFCHPAACRALQTANWLFRVCLTFGFAGLGAPPPLRGWTPGLLYAGYSPRSFCPPDPVPCRLFSTKTHGKTRSFQTVLGCHAKSFDLRLCSWSQNLTNTSCIPLEFPLILRNRVNLWYCRPRCAPASTRLDARPTLRGVLPTQLLPSCRLSCLADCFPGKIHGKHKALQTGCSVSRKRIRLLVCSWSQNQTNTCADSDRKSKSRSSRPSCGLLALCQNIIQAQENDTCM